jgi:short-subunit dehydrogenase
MSNYALVTGASSGIGYYFARELARRKINVLLAARSEKALQKLKAEIIQTYSVRCDYLSIDLSMPQAARTVFDWCKQNGYEVSILINNAGYGLFGNFKDQNQEDIDNMMHLNLHTLVALCHYFLPGMQLKPKAYILNVSSTSAYQAVPTMAVYAATKAFVLLFTRALRYEMKGTSVSVSCLSPGPTSSNFINRAGLRAIQKRADRFSMSADEVARRALDAMFRGRAEIIPGLLNRIAVQLTRITPKWITEKIAAGLYKDALTRVGH